MRVLFYSYFPILKNHLSGGAQLVTRDLILGLAESGINVRVLCPSTGNYENEDLLDHKRIEIMPVLKEKSVNELTVVDYLYNIQQAAKAMQDIDVIWTMDTSFPLFVSKPIVYTLGTIAYETEIEHLFRLNWDVLCVPSKFIFNIVDIIFNAKYWIPTPKPIKVIPFGVDLTHFSKKNSKNIMKKLGLSESSKYLLFPHRPDPNKGFIHALNIVEELIKYDEEYKLLIPKAPLSKLSERKKEKEYIKILKKRALKIGNGEQVIFHDWISYSELPEYFSIGDWCLSLSLLPEGFGLIPIQSISCGTPVICTKSGALRNQFPLNHGVKYVDIKDINQIITHIQEKPSAIEMERGRKYVEKKYNIKKTVKEYINCFKTVRKNTSLYSPNINNKSIKMIGKKMIMR